MAKRSTRNKLRWQADKAAEYMDKALEHLQAIDRMADSRSTFISTNLPQLASMIENIRLILLRFRDGM